MNKDIRVANSFKRSRKRRKLHRALGNDGVVGLIFLWMEAAEFRIDGVLHGYTAEDIAIAADWDGDEAMFVDTLIKIGFLDFDGETYAIHDWHVHNGYAMGAKSRSDIARFKRMSQVYPALWRSLRDDGMVAISSIEYQRAVDAYLDDPLCIAKQQEHSQTTVMAAGSTARQQPRLQRAQPDNSHGCREHSQTIATAAEGTARQQPRLQRAQPDNSQLVASTFHSIPFHSKTKDILSGAARRAPPYAEIVSCLNEACGVRFKPESKLTRQLIKARWEQGATLDDFIMVIKHRCLKWRDDPTMMEYLRPITLFSNKFESYLQDAIRAAPALANDPRYNSDLREAIDSVHAQSSGTDPSKNQELRAIFDAVHAAEAARVAAGDAAARGDGEYCTFDQYLARCNLESAGVDKAALTTKTGNA